MGLFLMKKEISSLKILYAGDSPVGGAANYLLAILGSMGAKTKHIPPHQALTPKDLETHWDGIIFSDYSASRVAQKLQNQIIQSVNWGTGFLMVGGWASFAGPFGGWASSPLEEILPVRCLAKDDRQQFPGGVYMVLKKKHPIFSGISFKPSPVLCGLNLVRPKRTAQTLLTARKIRQKKNFLALESREYPLLVIDANPQKRVAVFTTDLAPHWCGGLVDWGTSHLRLSVQKGIRVEVGDLYVQFTASLIRWIAGAKEAGSGSSMRSFLPVTG